MTLKSGRTATYLLLRWFGTGMTGGGKPKLISESLGHCTRARGEELRRAKVVELSTGASPIDPRESMTLSAFREFYLERRAQHGDNAPRRHKKFPKLTAKTLRGHDMTLRYLEEHFGPGQMIDAIGSLAADEWLVALEGEKLAKARKVGRNYAPLGEQSIRVHIRNAKAILHWARSFDLVTANPFNDFVGTPLRVGGRGHYVSLVDFEKIVTAASSQWRCMFGLCRLAGLRRGEALSLPWSGQVTDPGGERHRVGVDWERRRLGILSDKTRRYRELPICPRLYDVLLRAFDNAEDGQVTVTGLSVNNVVRDGKRLVRAAGLTPWPKLFQAMRSSCENDLKVAGIAEPTYASWMGHSPTVSRQHYVAPLESEFAAVTAIGE
ncbi:MAG: hypothetical protein IH830_03075 [Planctomycetes bacterium]|nr:hypothetical protein [Planctomycetota bacterium]